MPPRCFRFHVVALPLLLVAAGCGDDAKPRLLDDPFGPFPERFSEVALRRSDGSLSSRAIAYQPRYPLYSNGSEKERHLVLPRGEAVVRGSGPWSFPAGTLFFKTFDFGQGPVETRVMRFEGSGWDYAVYLWSDESEDAFLLDGRSPTPVTVWDGRVAFEHRVPSHRQCRECHESSPVEVLGFRELQLTDPDGGTEVLRTLAERGVFADGAPSAPALISAPHALDEEVLGYIEGNCVHCHNGSQGVSSSFDLGHTVALEAMIDQETQSSASAPGVRIVPGQPSDSILFLALSGETIDPEVKQMPPVGVEWRDYEAVELFRTWILDLGSREEP
jgi:hypothetical protein